MNLGKMVGIKWQPLKNPLKVSVTTPKMTLLDAVGLASMAGGGWANLMKGGLKSLSTKNLASSFGLDHLAKNVASGNLGKLGLADLATLSNVTGSGGGVTSLESLGIPGLDPKVAKMIDGLGLLSGSGLGGSKTSAGVAGTGAVTSTGDVTKDFFNTIMGLATPMAIRGLADINEYQPVRMGLLDRALAENSAGGEEAQLQRFLTQTGANARGEAAQTGAELTAQGASPAITDSLMHEAGNKATEQANEQRMALADPARRLSILSGLMQMLTPEQIAPELTMGMNFANQKMNADATAQGLQIQRDANRRPSILESALPTLATVASGVDWGKVFNKPKAKPKAAAGVIGGGEYSIFNDSSMWGGAK